MQRFRPDFKRSASSAAGVAKTLAACVALTAIYTWPMAWSILEHAPQTATIHVADLLGLIKEQCYVFTAFFASATVLSGARIVAGRIR
jgi:hypothetical protein